MLTGFGKRERTTNEALSFHFVYNTKKQRPKIKLLATTLVAFLGSSKVDSKKLGIRNMD